MTFTEELYWKGWRFGMNKAKPFNTPLPNHFKLSSYQSLETNKGIHFMSKVPYANIVECLMYVMAWTRLGFAHAVSVISRFMTNLG